MAPIYLDYNATTPVAPEVQKTMIPFFQEHFGNAASNHPFGWRAKEGVDLARDHVAKLINASQSKEIVFTSGATESNHLAILGICQPVFPKEKKRIITQKTEHPSVLEIFQYLEKNGYEVIYLNTDHKGRIQIPEFENALNQETRLVSIMAANNEIGTIQPIKELAKICRKQQIIFHTDAAQAVGKIPVDVQDAPIDLLSFSAHKMYGPKGVGALYIAETKPAIRLAKTQWGGGQEYGIRSGTVAVPLVAGFGKACEIAHKTLGKDIHHLLELRAFFLEGLRAQLTDFEINGHETETLPGTVNLAIGGVDGESLLMSLSELAISSGSACSSKKKTPSHVLMALGKGPNLAYHSIRFSFGRPTTKEEVTHAQQLLIEKVNHLRSLAA